MRARSSAWMVSPWLVDRNPPLRRLAARVDSHVAAVARAVAQRVEEEIVEHDTEQRAVALDDRELGGEDADLVGADLGIKRLDGDGHELLKVDGFALERQAAGAGVVEERVHQLAHARETANQVLEVGAGSADVVIVQLVLEQPCACLGGDQRRHQLVRRHSGEHLHRGALALEARQPRWAAPARPVGCLASSSLSLQTRVLRARILHDLLRVRLPAKYVCRSRGVYVEKMTGVLPRSVMRPTAAIY